MDDQVDVIGLKTILAIPKEFVVHRTKVCCIQQSNITLPSIIHSRDDHVVEISNDYTPLLPGLPDDLVIACLIRVPRMEHQKLRLVSKGWCRLLAEDFFYSMRWSHGFSEEWIYVIKRERDETISFHAFDPIYQLWQPLPPVPNKYIKAYRLGCGVLSGCNLYLFGDDDPRNGGQVIFYSARTNKWHPAPDMLERRHLCGSCVIDNRLYVAGGVTSEGEFRILRSVEVYDPTENKWSFVADMRVPMVPISGFVYSEKWFLKGFLSDSQVLNEVYEPETGNWFPVNNGMVERWTKPRISMNGNLYTLGCNDGCKLDIYDMDTDSWGTYIDSELHLGNSQALKAEAIVPLNGKLCVIRNNMSISVVDVSKYDEGEEVRASYHLWEEGTTEGKGQQFKSFITNMWSNFTGRNYLKSRILHCQVLQA